MNEMNEVVVGVDVLARADTVWRSFGAPPVTVKETIGTRVVVQTDDDALAQLLFLATRVTLAEQLELFREEWPDWAVHAALYEMALTATFTERALVAVLAVLAGCDDVAELATATRLGAAAVMAARRLKRWQSQS